MLTATGLALLVTASLAGCGGPMGAEGAPVDDPGAPSDLYPVEGQAYLTYSLETLSITSEEGVAGDLPDDILLSGLEPYAGDFGDVSTLLYASHDGTADCGLVLTVSRISDPAPVLRALTNSYETESGPHELALHFSPVLMVSDDSGDLFAVHVPAETAAQRPAEAVIEALAEADATAIATGRDSQGSKGC